MSQNATRVAHAIVGYEIGCRQGGGGEDSSPSPTLTVGELIEKYRLDWGLYTTPNGGEIDKAQQVLRNVLNVFVDRGALKRVGKDGRWIIYQVV